MRYSEADIQEFIADNDVKFIKFAFNYLILKNH